MVTVDIVRGYLHKPLSATIEYIVESDKGSRFFSTNVILTYTCPYMKLLIYFSFPCLRQSSTETDFPRNGHLLYYAGHTEAYITS